MHPVLTALFARPGTADTADATMWSSFWADLDAGRLAAGEAVALLTAMAVHPPDAATAVAMVATLRARHPAPVAVFPDAVNIVGTGGGPPTFNISTAAAFVAAATGVRVLKTGSRAHTSRHGSLDLLSALGVRLTSGPDETAHALDRFGLAFGGLSVYPPGVGQLARAVHPLRLREVGRFLNTVGPLLPNVLPTAQLTGVSDHALLPMLRQVADATVPGRVWLCTNDLGADELIGFGDDVLHGPGAAAPVRVADLGFAGGPGTLADLRAVMRGVNPVDHFLSILAGRANPAAVRSVCLNAAALRILCGADSDWRDAVAHASEAVHGGAALDLAKRIRATRPAGVGRSDG